MPSVIKEISLWYDNPLATNNVPLVKLDFNHNISWLVLSVDELLNIIRFWIKGEEIKYPLAKGFQGRYMLLQKILDVFNERNDDEG